MSHATVLVSPEIARVSELGLERAIEWEMMPFDENDECFRDGSRWDWYVIGGRYAGRLHGGNVLQVKQLDLAKLREERLQRLTETYQEAYSRENLDAETREFLYGVKAESLEEFIGRQPNVPLTAYAFLSNRHWNEGERLGWFGTSTFTECELKDLRKAKADPKNWFSKCLHKDESTGARVVCWNEPEEIWQENFYRRFIAPLEPERMIAMVDYHV